MILARFSSLRKHSKARYILTLFVTYDTVLLLLCLVVKPTLWLFDDSYVIKNNLIHYVDFRPGYPPLGKLPYTFLYIFFGNNFLTFVIYNIVVLDMMLYVLFEILSEVASPRRAKILTLVAAVNPLLIWATICIFHADLLAVVFLLLGLHALIKRRIPQVGMYCGLGFLTKIYPAVLLLPAFFKFGIKEKLTLISTFMTTILFLSLPFVMLDPLMYASTFLHHMYRGPSESIFALLDGYFLHTGFLHPTFEATIYAWQFTRIYQPSQYDHFRYEWRYPLLRYLSLVLQLGFLLLFSYLSGKTFIEHRLLESTSLVMLIFFALSAFWNPLIAVPVFPLLIFATLEKSLVYQLFMTALLTINDYLHIITWFLPLPFGIEIPLLIVTSFRTMLFTILFLFNRFR